MSSQNRLPAAIRMPPPWVLAIMLALLTLAVYLPAIGYNFVSYDDNVYVTSNAHVQNGITWEGLKWAFGKPDETLGYWHPVTLLSHMLDCQVFGVRPWGHHLTSILVHALNAALVFLLLRQLTGETLSSLLVAVLFAVHPLRVESVAWVAERKDVLSGCFGLLALIFYTRYARAQQAAGTSRTQPRRAPYLLALCFFALGLMSKPMLVTWPFVMLLLDYWPLGRNAECRVRSAEWPWRKLVWEKVPFFALSALTTAAALVTQEQAGALGLNESLPLSARAANTLMSYGRYLVKMLWPVDLAVFYPFPAHWPMPLVLMTGAALFSLSVLLLLGWRRHPALLMGWLWYCGTLLPVSGLVQVGEFSMADRFTYLPSLGVLILAVWGGRELTCRWRHAGTALASAGMALSVVAIVMTRQQLRYWENTEALFRHALAVTQDNYVAHIGLGLELVRKEHLDEGIEQYQQALRLKPDFALAHNNLGLALLMKGRVEEAISQYKEAVRLKPDYPLAYNNLGNAFHRLGRDEEAIKYYREAIRLNPDYADAHNDLGLSLYRAGQTEEAATEFREALRINPTHSAARQNLESIRSGTPQHSGGTTNR